jgi:hypothetical protein
MGVESLGEDKKKNKKGSWVDDGIVVMDHHQKSRSTSSNYCYIKTNAEHFVMGGKKKPTWLLSSRSFQKEIDSFLRVCQETRPSFLLYGTQTRSQWKT